MTTMEKIAHLNGLMEGMNFDANTNEGKLFHAIVIILTDIAVELEDVDEAFGLLAENVQSLEDRADGLEAAVDEAINVMEGTAGDFDDDDEDDDWFDDDDDDDDNDPCADCDDPDCPFRQADAQAEKRAMTADGAAAE